MFIKSISTRQKIRLILCSIYPPTFTVPLNYVWKRLRLQLGCPQCLNSLGIRNTIQNWSNLEPSTSKSTKRSIDQKSGSLPFLPKKAFGNSSGIWKWYVILGTKVWLLKEDMIPKVFSLFWFLHSCLGRALVESISLLAILLAIVLYSKYWFFFTQIV